MTFSELRQILSCFGFPSFCGYSEPEKESGAIRQVCIQIRGFGRIRKLTSGEREFIVMHKPANVKLQIERRLFGFALWTEYIC